MEHRLKILIADDEPLVRATCGALLRGAGFDPLEADGAAQALQILAEQPISLVISDIQMPGNEDLAFLRELGARHPGLPVILLTAHPTLDSAVQSFGLAAAYLIKPPDAERLLSTIQQSLGQYEARRAVGQSLARLKTWTRDLEKLKDLVSIQPAAADPSAAQAYIDLSVHNLAGSLHDLSELVSALAASPGGASNLRSFELEKAVRETVAVLEATRRNFKSKELGELRQRLESLLIDP